MLTRREFLQLLTNLAVTIPVLQSSILEVGDKLPEVKPSTGELGNNYGTGYDELPEFWKLVYGRSEMMPQCNLVTVPYSTGVYGSVRMHKFLGYTNASTKIPVVYLTGNIAWRIDQVVRYGTGIGQPLGGSLPYLLCVTPIHIDPYELSTYYGNNYIHRLTCKVGGKPL